MGKTLILIALVVGISFGLPGVVDYAHAGPCNPAVQTCG